MAKKSNQSKMNHKKTLSIIMAAVNGLNTTVPLALPLAVMNTEIPRVWHLGAEELAPTSFNRGGQILNSLFFTTAYAEEVSGEKIVSAGQTADGDVITSGGTQMVWGSATSTTINGAKQLVNSGGSATSTIISRGYQFVSSGGSATSTTISGGQQSVSGSATNTIIYSGGAQFVYSGGSATSTAISGGQQLVYGNATNTTMSGGQQLVYSGGSAIGTIISGGQQFVNSGASASDTTINGGGEQVVVGSVINTTIHSDGMQNVYDGGSAISTTINSGGIQSVDSGGSATGTTINFGGTQTVYSGGSVISTTINFCGEQEVSRGGSATGTTISGGGQVVSSGGSATNTTINSEGNQYVSSGGSASDTTINFGGKQTVYSGGSAINTTINGGGIQYAYGSATGTTINGGVQYVYGSATGTAINSGGIQSVERDGTASGTTVNVGGLMNMYAGAQITGVTTLSGGTAALRNKGSYTIANLTVTSGGTVKLANGTTVGRNLAINNLSGSANFIINTDLAQGKADTITITAVTGSSVNTLQVAYDPAFVTGQNVTGTANFATVSGGSASFTATATEYGAYSYTPTLSSATSAGTTTWTITALNQGDVSGASETVKTASDAIAGNLLTWRTENNNLTKRMGELRNASGEAGFWLRSYRGAEELAGSSGRSLKQQYTALQGGYDSKISRGDGALYTGYALGYLEGSSNYNRGTGDVSSLSLGAYGSWLGDKGHFFDIITKVSKLKNSYTNYLSNSVNTRVDSNYDNWGTSLSAEYGYRKQLKNNWYLEPQAELTYNRISSASYTASDGTNVHNDTVNALTGRLGLAVGRNVGSTHYYGKVSAVREFSANAVITASSGAASLVTYQQNLKENWLEFALGLTAKLDKRVDGYLEFTRTNGDKVKTPWQVNAGVRWNY